MRRGPVHMAVALACAALIGPHLMGRAQAESGAQPEVGALSAEAFDALTRGKVMNHFQFGEIYGAEQYLPDRRVIWKDGDGCMRGHWTETSPGLLCFRYDGVAETWCWSYLPRPDGGFDALLNGQRGDNPVTLMPGRGPLSCDEDAPSA